jgi:DNA polymerase-3 subunit epsilon
MILMELKYITILDVETTGFDPSSDVVIEIGAILYSLEFKSTVMEISTLIPVDSNPAVEVNNIEVGLTQLVNSDMLAGFKQALKAMLDVSSYAVAFNSDFDSSFLPWINRPWADAALIQYPRETSKRDLVNLALNNGIPVVSAHRALTDCRLLAELLSRVPNLEEQLTKAARPKQIVRALVSYDQRNLAKQHHFVWNAIVPNAWARKMPLEDTQELPFQVAVVS